METRLVKLKDVADISTGYPFDGHKYGPVGIRVLRGENIGNYEIHFDERTDKRWNEDFDKSALYLLRDNDIILQMDGNVGKNKAKLRASDLPMYIAQRVGCIRAKEGTLQDFLYYIIQEKTFQRYLETVMTGTSIKHISLEQIGDYAFRIPDLEHQLKIAGVLKAMDEKIYLNQQINRNLAA